MIDPINNHDVILQIESRVCLNTVFYLLIQVVGHLSRLLKSLDILHGDLFHHLHDLWRYFQR